MSKYDAYGGKIFLQSEPRPFGKTGNGEGFIFNQCDPKKLKLFLLSVLWRFSISTLPETANIKLPIKFENALKQLIAKEDSGGVDDFSIVITRLKFKSPDDELRKIFAVPTPCRTSDGINHWCLHIPNGYDVLIKVDNRKQSEGLRGATLCNGEKTIIICTKKFEDSMLGQAAMTAARKANF